VEGSPCVRRRKLGAEATPSRVVSVSSRGHHMSPVALDPDNAERLWEVSEALVGERFPLRP